jgi:hypothetical protein
VSHFTIEIAERMATDCGLPCTGRELLPLLQAAETAHDAAVAQMEEGRERPAQNRRRLSDQKFVAAARELWQAWQAMDEGGRGRLAWSAVYGGKPNPASKWLREAVAETVPTAKAPYGESYAGVEHRIEQMIIALGTLPMETPHLDAKPGVKKQLAGLEAAYAVFRKAWPKWVPKYDKADTAKEALAGKRVPVGNEGALFLSFAQMLDASYTAENCFTASGGRESSPTKK